MKGYIFIENVIAVESGTVTAYHLSELHLKRTDFLDIWLRSQAPLSPHLGEMISFFRNGLKMKPGKRESVSVQHTLPSFPLLFIYIFLPDFCFHPSYVFSSFLPSFLSQPANAAHGAGL